MDSMIESALQPGRYVGWNNRDLVPRVFTEGIDHSTATMVMRQD
jgi:hypothetical protein